MIVKGEEVMSPFVTHCDASGTVVAESSAFDSIASVNNGAPSSVNLGSHHVMLDPADAFSAKLFEFRLTGGCKHFFVQTSARGRIAPGEVASHDPERVPTFTAAEPIDASSVWFASAFSGTDDGESAKNRIS